MSAKRKRAGFPCASPEDQGMSSKILNKVNQGTRLEVRQLGSCAGVAHIVLRKGRCVLALADGWANKSRKTRFGLDTICRLHGSTKGLVCAAFMTLLDDGAVKLDDPVAQHMNFSEQVVTSRGSVRAARIRPTVRHLLTQTAGLRYTDCTAYRKIIGAVKRGKIADLGSFCSAIAKVPLQFEPGSQFDYSFCTDFVGRLCEVLSGDSLDVFLQRRLLKPLGMRDTGFKVPPSKQRRKALLYECKEVPSPKRGKGKSLYIAKMYRHADSAPGIMSAGGGILSYMDAGMWGTAQDYARFCQMLLTGRADGGGGPSILKASSLKAIWQDGLHPLMKKGLSGWDVDDTEGPPFEGGSWKKCGWSLLNSLLQCDSLPRRGSQARMGHTMGLGGGGGTYWLVDAKRKLVAITFSQSFDGGRTANDGLGPPGYGDVMMSGSNPILTVLIGLWLASTLGLAICFATEVGESLNATNKSTLYEINNKTNK